MIWTKEELDKLRGNLPSGWADLIAEKLNLKPGSVKQVFTGRRKNEEVITAALELALSHRQTIVAQKELLNSL